MNPRRLHSDTSCSIVCADIARAPYLMFAPSDYSFELPPELIAQEPAPQRDAARLLHIREAGALSDHTFAEIVDLLPPDAVVVANDTRVIPARVLGNKPTGGKAAPPFLAPPAPHRCPPAAAPRP